MMGADSVEYHRATVLGRADDHPGMALEYYASRGETPWFGVARAQQGSAYRGQLQRRSTRRSWVRAGPRTRAPENDS